MHRTRTLFLLLTACAPFCLGGACQAQQAELSRLDAHIHLEPLMNVPHQVVYQSDFDQVPTATVAKQRRGNGTPRETSRTIDVDKTIWQARQGTRWTVANGVLLGEQSTPEYQAQREHHHGYEPRIKSLKTPRQFVAKFSVRFRDGEETKLVPLIEFGHHNVRLKFSKTGIVLLADHEQVQLAQTHQLRLESGRWYHLLAERQADEFVVQFSAGPTLYAKHKSLAIPVANDSDGLGIAGTRHGTVEIDNITLWSIQPDKRAPGWNTVVKKLTANMADPLIIQKRKTAKEQSNPRPSSSSQEN